MVFIALMQRVSCADLSDPTPLRKGVLTDVGSEG